MGAETAGRKLGIGLRLAARAVQQRAAEATAPRPPATQPPAASSRSSYKEYSAYASTPQRAENAPKLARGVAQGAKRFGTALWGPMAHTGSVLWLEITGLFFALFAAFFGQNAYRFRHDFAGGAERIHFFVYAALTLAFAWFTFSSFHKARRKEKKNRARRLTR